MSETEGVECAHCWHYAGFQHAVQYHRDEKCCRCGAEACVSLSIEPDPNHGTHVCVTCVTDEKRTIHKRKTA